jgi:hypothetical protein
MIVEEPFTEHRASGWPRDLFANWYGTAYCTDGSIAFEGYIDGRGNILGEGKWYYPDGTLQASGTFRDGKLIGGFRRFDESGALVEKIGKVAEERRSGSLH